MEAAAALTSVTRKITKILGLAIGYGLERDVAAASRIDDDTGLRLADDFRTTFRGLDCKPHFVGVWDTVSSVGWIENPLKLRFTADNPDIAIGRHAVSIDERRAFFRSNLWRPSPKLTEHGPRDVQQVWFPGVHCDIGGGYPEAKSGVSKYATVHGSWR